MRVYLISPSPDFGNRRLNDDHSIGFGKPYALNAAVSIATIAAYFPDSVDLRLCDQIVHEVDYDDPADVIAISVNVAQAPNAAIIARRFRALGRKVILGGAHVSLVPELFNEISDCLVIGEFEPIAHQFMADLITGQLKSRYQGSKADLALSPMPRWDLYPNDLALAGVVQTSRGCPFDCTFCDVIQYLGRVQRHKPPERVLREVQALYDLGYRQINLSDDNFTVYRQRTHELLEVMAAWNGRDGREPVSFLTQMSIDVARHPDLLAACSKAGLRSAFVGIETSNPDALKESRKRQNLRVDLLEQCEKIVSSGIAIQSGLIVGFDSDDLTCFERQLSFVQALPIVNFRLSVLMAPAATPLYQQMKEAGRLVEETTLFQAVGAGSMTNIQPAQMTREQLAEGAEWLRNEIVAPENVLPRFEYFARILGDCPPHLVQDQRGAAARRAAPLMELMLMMMRDRDARRVIECVRDLASDKPDLRSDLMQQLSNYLNTYARSPTASLAAPQGLRFSGARQ